MVSTKLTLVEIFGYLAESVWRFFTLTGHNDSNLDDSKGGVGELGRSTSICDENTHVVAVVHVGNMFRGCLVHDVASLHQMLSTFEQHSDICEWRLVTTCCC